MEYRAYAGNVTLYTLSDSWITYNIVAVSFIGGVSRSTRRKPPPSQSNVMRTRYEIADKFGVKQPCTPSQVIVTIFFISFLFLYFFQSYEILRRSKYLSQYVYFRNRNVFKAKFVILKISRLHCTSRLQGTSV
jgi:hypothetical protein